MSRLRLDVCLTVILALAIAFPATPGIGNERAQSADGSIADAKAVQANRNASRFSDPIFDGIPREALTVPTVINVEVDYMYDSTHIHRLYQGEVDMLVGMFACQGITLNIDISDSIPEEDVLSNFGSGLFNGNYLSLKNQYFDHAGLGGWHYCIMAHTYDNGGGVTCSSGFAEIGGDDFIVTLGCWFAEVGFPFDRAGTFAHELGHNLGLRHAGNQNENIIAQYKPNYASVMTYLYQVNGVRNRMDCVPSNDACHVLPMRDLDYSHGMLSLLDESALIEADGIGFGPIDWNGNALIDAGPVAVELTGPSSLNVLTDYDDWSNIVDVTFLSSASALSDRPTIACATLEEVQRAQAGLAGTASGCTFPVPVLVEPCEYPADDADDDGLVASCDNCPNVANVSQEDGDLDGDGNVCDNCPSTPNGSQQDADTDGVGDVCDNCPAVVNPLQDNYDSDGLGDLCDPCPAYATPGNGPFLTGDVNQDAQYTSADIIYLVNYTFKSGPAPLPVAGVGDVNCSRTVTSSDIIYMVTHVFKGGPAPCEGCAL